MKICKDLDRLGAFGNLKLTTGPRYASKMSRSPVSIDNVVIAAICASCELVSTSIVATAMLEGEARMGLASVLRVLPSCSADVLPSCSADVLSAIISKEDRRIVHECATHISTRFLLRACEVWLSRFGSDP